MQSEIWGMYDQYNVLSNELWSADTYEWVEWVGDELSDLARQIERQEKKLNNQLQTIHEWEQQMNSLNNDGYVEDLQAEVQFRALYVSRLTEEVNNFREEIAGLTGDDKAIAEAKMAFVIEKRDEQSDELAHATEYFNQEFERRKAEKQEELFWQMYDTEQNSVNQLWYSAQNMETAMSVFHKLEEIAWNNGDNDYAAEIQLDT